MMYNQISNTILKYTRVIVIMFLIFIGLKSIGYMMPTSMVRDNVAASVNQLKEEGLGYKAFYNTDTVFFGQQMDNWTDSIYLNVAYSFGNYSIIERVAGDFRIFNSKVDNEVDNFIVGLTEGGETIPYARQWFGCMSILRIMLTVFTYPEIRLISQMFFVFLLFIVSNMIRKKVDYNTSIAYFVAILFGNLPVMSASINIVNAFYVVLFATIMVLYLYPKTYDAALHMFIVGGVTCYLDLFVTPLLTYVFIMGMLLIIEYKNNQDRTFLYYLKKTVHGSIGWLMGYFILWISKWIFSSIILKENLYNDIISEMSKMSAVGTIAWAPTSKLGLVRASVLFNMENMFPINFLLVLKNRGGMFSFLLFSIICVSLIVMIIIRIKNSDKKSITLILLIVSMAPYVWYIVLHTHSFVHYWMTYRLQCGTVFLLLSILGYGISMFDKKII